MFESIILFTPLVGTSIAVGVTLWAAHFLLIRRRSDLGNERMFSRQLTMLGLTLLGILVIVLVMPINQSSRNQLISLFGIVISAMIALSSTAIISNLMAGVLLRITKPFKVGDFIRIGGHVGRVSERGLFETEVQTETRELISIPNTYCISNPLATIQSSGTIISASLSLGYEIDHNRVDQLLIEAAKTCGLTEPFVHILELGSFTVTYRLSGFLEEAKRHISMQSKLYGCVLDTLHSQNIEIMSPSYMNQRQILDGASVIPTTTRVTVPAANNDASAEEIGFDKAERAEKLENEKFKLNKEISSLEIVIKKTSSEENKKTQLESVEKKRRALELLEKASSDFET
jgi:small conductance mechanosensitive channel